MPDDFEPKNYYVESLMQENRFLRQTIESLRKQVDILSSPPLMVCEIVSVHGDHAVIKIPNGNFFYVNIVNSEEKYAPGDSVLVDKNNLNIINKIDVKFDLSAEEFVILEKPKITWSDIGGLDEQIREITEVVELPLKKPELFKKVGINPPKGILLYGPPGTGKTLLAKAVAHETDATFIEVVGSELVQKYIGEGSKLVKNIFNLARQHAPTIVFIDELDSIAAKRIELGTSGEREVQRTFMQLLAELDGFKSLDNVKVIAATNRVDILDPAILRPGRFGRLINVPLPEKDEALYSIFKIHTRKMNVDKIPKERIVDLLRGLSGAEINSLCTEAGYFALRENRTKVTFEDLEKAKKKVKKDNDTFDKVSMFG